MSVSGNADSAPRKDIGEGRRSGARQDRKASRELTRKASRGQSPSPGREHPSIGRGCAGNAASEKKRFQKRNGFREETHRASEKKRFQNTSNASDLLVVQRSDEDLTRAAAGRACAAVFCVCQKRTAVEALTPINLLYSCLPPAPAPLSTSSRSSFHLLPHLASTFSLSFPLHQTQLQTSLHRLLLSPACREEIWLV